MTKLKRIQRVVCMLMAALVMSGICTSGNAAAESLGDKILYNSNAKSDEEISADWREDPNVTITKDDNGYVFSIPYNKWPTVSMGDVEYDAGKGHKLSYKLKMSAAVSGRIYVYDEGTQLSFGDFFANADGTCTFKGAWDADGNAKFSADLDGTATDWYTIEVEWSEKPDDKYMQYTVKSESGNELAKSEKINGLWKGYQSGEVTASFAEGGKRIMFWNDMNNVQLNLKDIVLSELDNGEPENPDDPNPPVTENKVYLDEKFNGSLSDILAKGWHGQTDNVTVENGTLALPEGAYIYFDIPNKDAGRACRISYDIMTPEEVNQSGCVGLYGNTSNTTTFLGAYKPSLGLSCEDFSFSDSKTICKGSMPAGKWYTVCVEFCEREDSFYTIYKVYDRESGRLIGEHEYMNANAVARNTTVYYFWNRDGAKETYYVDNVKAEEIAGRPVFNEETSVSMVDGAGNVAEDLTAVSPSLRNIRLDFKTALSEESAASAILLVKYDGNRNESLVPCNGAVSDTGYVLTPVEPLEENTKYGIKISKLLVNTNGDTLGRDYTIRFTTGKAEGKAAIDGIYVGNSEITSLSAVTAGAEIKVKTAVSNATASVMNTAVGIVYYNGNKMVGTEMATDSFEARSGGDKEYVFTAPDDMNGVTSLTVLLWNGAADMLPYCSEVNISR